MHNPSHHLKRNTPESPLLLVADDDPGVRHGVADLLKFSGYQVLTAENGAIAWQILQKHMPDLIIADIAMPEMDGYELYDAVRSDPKWSLVPFIFLTARGEQKDIRYGYSLGADHYVTKPFEPEDLLAVVDARLKRMRIVQTAVESNAESMKRRLATTFSHELRTPLTAIYGFVSLLQDELEELTDEQVKEMLGHIEFGTQRLSRLTENLLMLLQIDSGAVAIEVERFSQPIDIGQVVNQAVRSLSSKAQERNIEVETRIAEALVVKGISPYLTDAITRLVDNALKFSRRVNGRILVTVYRQDDTVRIAVEDNGVGIPPDKQKQLFQCFEQIDRERLEQQGIGLGLAIAMSLAQLHGGTIEIESQEDVGSTFTLILPAL